MGIKQHTQRTASWKTDSVWKRHIANEFSSTGDSGNWNL